MEAGGRPTAAEVVGRLKDDGDFDALRLKIIRKVKENEELRNNIIAEVKQSLVLNEDGAENLKPRQLSDGIYQEIGNKIMGQISDELWKVIRSNDGMKNEIKETVESVYNRLVNPEKEKEKQSSPPRQKPPKRKRDKKQSHAASQQLISGKEDNGPSATVSTHEADISDGNEPTEPPGFASSNQPSNGNKGEHQELLHGRRSHSSSRDELHCLPETLEASHDELPPGFAPQLSETKPFIGVGEEDPDVPPGFG
ncbi:hypothetical protein J5N97_000605 [Dioscorea zingiberensis]|uniref:Uncharacterized protein n=1 Tax=Dioscorea zingiberensis TaxID=325984 RepID=A0A9D5BVE8_9LILI|nr:hypothetical protein J5N97_000605 [Dioscorea zingiberensis]